MSQKRWCAGPVFFFVGFFFWATTRTVQVSTVYLLGWLFTYKFFQCPWWAGRELRAEAVLARKWACTTKLFLQEQNTWSRQPNAKSLAAVSHAELLSISHRNRTHWHGLWHCNNLADHGTALWAAWQLRLITVCYGHTQSIWPQGSGDSCVAGMFPGWPKPGIQAVQCPQSTQRSALGSCSFPSPSEGVQSSRSISWCFPNMTLFYSSVPSLKMETFFQKSRISELLLLTGSADHLPVAATFNFSEISFSRTLDSFDLHFFSI